MSRRRDDDDQRGEREHPQREIELRDVVEQPAEGRPRLVAAAAGDAVVAERGGRRMSPGDLEEDHGEPTGERDSVQRRERRQPAGPAALDPRERERRGQRGDDERDRLRAGQEQDDAEREHEQLPSRGRPLEHRDECEREAEEERIERVLRHQRSRVGQRRQYDRERGRRQRRAAAQHAPCEEVGGDGRERHQHGVDRLRRPVDRRNRVEQLVRDREDRRIDDSVIRVRAADQEVAGVREAARGVGVDELVDHDPGRDDAPREQKLDDRRHEHDRAEPEPDRCPSQPCPGTWTGEGPGTCPVGTKAELRQAGGEELRVDARVGRCGRDLAQHLAVDLAAACGFLERGGVALRDRFEVVLALDVVLRRPAHRGGCGDALERGSEPVDLVVAAGRNLHGNLVRELREPADVTDDERLAE